MSNHTRKGPPSLSDAVKPIAANLSPNEMLDPNDIGDALTILAESGDPVSIYPAGGKPMVVARILSVDPERPHFVIELNGGDELPPGECTFVARVRDTKFQFRLNDPHWKALLGQPTLIPAEFPERCQVLNRRASERLEAPLGAGYTASFALNGKPYELQLYDISVGGVGMRCTLRDVTTLHVGRKIQSVRLELGYDREIVCDLEIRLARRFRTFLLGEQGQIGCRFINPSPQMQDELRGIIKHLDGNRVSR